MDYSLRSLLISLSLIISSSALAGNVSFNDKFRQLDELLPTPNTYRTASGAPGHEYWQQKVDYKIMITLDDKTQQLTGSESIHYQNNSPDTLRYLWLQLDQNVRNKNSDTNLTRTAPNKDKITFKSFRNMIEAPVFNGGYNISKLTDNKGNALHYVINNTMMRVDLAQP